MLIEQGDHEPQDAPFTALRRVKMAGCVATSRPMLQRYPRREQSDRPAKAHRPCFPSRWTARRCVWRSVVSA
jgi:hypothetical protein